MPYQQPPANYMFMPPGQNWPFPYNHSTNHAMDVDSPDSRNSSDGEWVGHACYQLLQHIHHENKTCNDPIGHTTAAKCNNDASYIAAAEHDTQLSKMRLDFNQKYSELQDKCSILLGQNSNLVIDNNALKQSVDHAHRESNTNPHNTGRGFSYSRPSEHGSNYCHHCDDNHSTISQSNHPRNTALTTKPIDWDNFSLPFASQEMGFSVLKHSWFHTGFDQSLVTINWDEAEGLERTSALVDNTYSIHQGEQTGIQSIPSSHANLESLVGGATTEENISTLHCLQFALVIAQMLKQTQDIDPQVNPFYRSKKDILSKVREANPEWACSSKFLNSRTYRLKEAPHKWKNSIQLPVAGAPQDNANCHNYVARAHYMFIFRDSNALLGIFMSDTRYIDLESAKDRLAFNTFHLAFICVVSKPGFFKYLVRYYNLTISNILEFLLTVVLK
ncbi:hypothetical protein L218DRAFT_951940 [Marasmius fiardii PR-910]|nr:hypothetical protein L218DRAFT_951940 [Marasmius fiardii PR-910]